ncbi:MAG: hypothetical protein ACI88H_002342 [Cocleimonas sp.]|jgi:hypothetical protein
MNEAALQMQIQKLEQQVKELQELTKFIKVTGNQTTIKTTGALTIEATTMDLNASAIVNIKGAMIKLNNGGKPATTKGSMTNGAQALKL